MQIKGISCLFKVEEGKSKNHLPSSIRRLYLLQKRKGLGLATSAAAAKNVKKEAPKSVCPALAVRAPGAPAAIREHGLFNNIEAAAPGAGAVTLGQVAQAIGDGLLDLVRVE